MDRFETCVRLRPTSLGYGLNMGVGWIMESKSTLRLMISGIYVDCGVLNQYGTPWKGSRLGYEDNDNEFDFGLLRLKGL